MVARLGLFGKPAAPIVIPTVPADLLAPKEPMPAVKIGGDNEPTLRLRPMDQALHDSLLATGIHPVLARVFAARGIEAEDFALGMDGLPHKEDLDGCMQAGELLAEAVMKNQRVVIVGDYDADGATSTALLLRAIRACGGDVDFVVPNRMIHGYGLSPVIAKMAYDKGCKLLVTVDNGVSAVAGVEAAKNLGMKVLISDHHLQGDVLPNADCLVNPNLNDSKFPSRCLAGVGVAFYVAAAMKEALKAHGWQKTVNLSSLLDLVAIGTVGDLVPLDRTNRILVRLGVERIRAGKASTGINGILEAALLKPELVNSDRIGFVIAPRINAAGRMETADIGISLLASDDKEFAIYAAAELEAINRDRKQKQAEMTDSAMAIVDAMPQVDYAAVVYDEDFHEGIVGLVASKVKDRLNRPSAAFAKAEDGSIKGSFRSIAGVHIRDVIDLVSKRNPGLVLKFGGHAMAAGATIKKDGVEEFRLAFVDAVKQLAPADAFLRTIDTDGELTATELTLDLADQIAQHNWGNGIPAPTFNGTFKVLSQRVLGEKHLKMTVEIGGRQLDAIQFNETKEVDGSIDVTYRLDINEYRGERKLQLLVENRISVDASPRVSTRPHA